MQTRDLIELILSTLLGLGAVVASLAYLYDKYLEGRDQQKYDKNKKELETISLYKERVEALESKVDELMVIVGDLRKDIAIKDEKLTNALNILQGRDPTMLSLMENMKTYMEDNKPFIENIKMTVLPVVAKLDKYLDGQIIK